MGKGDKSAAAAALEPKKLERFVRIVEYPLRPGEQHRGYQPEVLWVEGDRVVKRQLLDKPNLFEYAFTHIGDLIDPRVTNEK